MAETGHARNIERFATMISFVQGYGVTYNPALAPWKVVVNDRQNAFEGIRKLTTRVVNSFDASGAPKNAARDAKSFKRKIDGARAKTLPSDDPNTPCLKNAPAIRKNRIKSGYVSNR